MFMESAEILHKDGIPCWPRSGPPKKHPITDEALKAIVEKLEGVEDLEILGRMLVECIADCMQLAHICGIPLDELWQGYRQHKMHGKEWNVRYSLGLHGYRDPEDPKAPHVGQVVYYGCNVTNVIYLGIVETVSSGDLCSIRFDGKLGVVHGVKWYLEAPKDEPFQFCYPKQKGRAQ
jgi:hypothetical protein